MWHITLFGSCQHLGKMHISEKKKEVEKKSCIGKKNIRKQINLQTLQVENWHQKFDIETWKLGTELNELMFQSATEAFGIILMRR